MVSDILKTTAAGGGELAENMGVISNMGVLAAEFGAPYVSSAAEITGLVAAIGDGEAEANIVKPPGLEGLVDELSSGNKPKELVKIGSGSTGVVYRYNRKSEAGVVIKELHYSDPETRPWLDPDRASRILNEVNNDPTFSSVVTSASGKKFMVSKYVPGEPIRGEEAFNFVKERSGRILVDAHQPNVIRDSLGKNYLIDPDYALDPNKSIVSKKV